MKTQIQFFIAFVVISNIFLTSQAAEAGVAGVVVSSPAANASVGTVFSLQAQSNTCQGQPVATMAYSVGNGVDSAPVNGTSLSAQVSAPVGQAQILHVKSWGNKGAGCDTDVTVNVNGGGVSVSAPTANTTVKSPFQLTAQSTSCDGQIVATVAYSIGNGANSAPVNGTSLNVQVVASAGQGQVLHVKSWGRQGAGCVMDVLLNVAIAGTGFDGSSNIPNPPASAINIAGIQKLGNWKSATGAASSCANGVPSATCNPPNANYNSTIVPTGDPAPLSGSQNQAGLFNLYNSPAYSTVIWGHSLLTSTASRNFIWDFNIYVNSANYYSSELDLYTTLNNGQRFMMGTQCNRAANSWDTWSESKQKWINNVSIPCNQILTPGVWHHVTFYSTVNSSNNTYTYHVIRVDGIDYVLNQTQSTENVGWPDGLIGVQVQLDNNASGTGVSEYLENTQLYSW